MYPQCQYKAVKVTVQYYASQCLPPLQQEKIRKCLESLKFSMGNTIVSFRDKYYEYGVDPNPDCQGLTIGGFELAFLADLLEASDIFDKLSYILKRCIQFFGTFHDNKIIVFQGSRSNKWLYDWLNTFQSQVDRLLGTLDSQFTMVNVRTTNQLPCIH